MSSSRYTYLKKRLGLYPCLLIFIIWFALYLPNLRFSPPWYGDETLMLIMSRDLFSGSTSVGPLLHTYWHSYIPYQPAFAWLIGFASHLSGDDISGARLLNTILALATALVIYLGARPKIGVIAAWLASLLFLTYDQSIIHFRWIYPHNFLALGTALSVVALLRPSRPKNNFLAGVGIGLGSMAHPLFVHAAFAAILCRLRRPSAWLYLAIPSAVVIFSTFAFILAVYWPHHWLFQDLSVLVSYYGSRSEDSGSLWQFLNNVRIFFSQDWFHVLAFVGLCLCLNRRLYPIAIFGFTISALLLQNRQNLTLFYYQAIILLPLFSLAIGAGVSRLSRWSRSLSISKTTTRLVTCLSLFAPMTLLALQLPTSLYSLFIPRNHPWVTQDMSEVERAAKWINERTSPGDLVIANSNLAWLLHARSADLLQATIWSGVPTQYFSTGFPRERFRYPADIKSAKFVVIGDIDRRWTLGQPNVGSVIEKSDLAQWPVVWRESHYLILANPSWQASLPADPTPATSR